MTCGGYARDLTWSYKHQRSTHEKMTSNSRRRVRESRRSQGTDYEPKSHQTATAMQLDSSAICAQSSPSPSYNLINHYFAGSLQLETLETWLPNNSPVECMGAGLDMGQIPWSTSTSAFTHAPIPSTTVNPKAIHDLTLPATLSRGPEATEKLIANWFEQVCPAWSAFDSCLNPNRKLASELMLHSPLVFDTLQSMSASFLSARLPQLKRPALGLLKTAAAAVIAEADSLRNKVILEVVPTGLLFSLFCIGTTVCWLDAGRLGLPFLQLAKDLLQRISSQTLVGDDQLEILAFFRKSLMYWEMLLSFTDDYDLSGHDQGLGRRDLQLTPGCDVVGLRADLLLHPWTGISTRPTHLFAQSIRLCRSHRRRISKRSGADIALSEAMRELEEAKRLQGQLLSLEFHSTPSINHQTGDQRTPWLHLIRVAEAYQLSSLLQLYLTLPDLPVLRSATHSNLPSAEGVACDTSTISLALRICRLLEQIPAESGSRSIQPLLYICASAGLCYPTAPIPQPTPACAASAVQKLPASPLTSKGLQILAYVGQMDTEDDQSQETVANFVSDMVVDIATARSFIIRRLDTLECTLQPRPIAVAKQLVKAIWAAYDDANKRFTPGHWMDIMDSNDLRSLFG